MLGDSFDYLRVIKVDVRSYSPRALTIKTSL